MKNNFYSNREIGCLPNPAGGFLAWYRADGVVSFVIVENGNPEVFGSEAEAFAHASVCFMQGA